MTVADRIRTRREKLGLSQEELAKRLGLKSRSSVTRIEKSGDNISLKDVERIAYVLDCSKLYLMGWEEETSVENNEDDERAERFMHFYSQLDDNQKTIIDNLLASLVKKQ